MPPRKLGQYLAGTILLLSVLLVVIWIAGQVLRDRNLYTGLMFYFPTPILATALILLAMAIRRHRWLYLALAAAPIGMLLFVENRWVRPELPGDVVLATGDTGERMPLRLVHWNVCHGELGWEKQWEHIERLHPDVIVLSEIPEPFDPRTVTGFEVLIIDGMAVACHGSMTTTRPLVSGGALDAYHVTCLLEDGSLELLIADMTSRIALPRDPYLRPFIGLLAAREIDIVVGDLNAPRRSLAFSELPVGYRHAYDAAGAGWSYTWPVPIPVLAIDQCIIGPRMRPIRYELESTLLSDHRLQVLDIEWNGSDLVTESSSR